jgi:hypothetical protein
MPPKMSPFPIHFAIDLEPDERLPGEDDKSFDSAGTALERMLSLRSEIEAATGAPVHFGWYVRMDRHIEALYGDPCAIAVRYKSLLNAAAHDGDEVGLHIHVMDRRDDGGWRANYADEKAVYENIRESFGAFRSFFGRQCISARMGDMWTSTAAMRQIARCGARYDVTLETGLRPQGLDALYPGTNSKGWRPSLLGAPLAPFQHYAVDGKKFWLLPLSSYPRNDFHHPGMWLVSAYSSLTTGFRRCRARKMLRPQGVYPPGAVKSALNAALKEGKQPGFCFAIRNFGAGDRVEAFLQALMEMAREKPVKFCTPEEYVRLVTAA